MAEIFLGAFVNALVEKLASGDLWNIARTERIGTQLTKWSSMLAQVQAVVADAEEKQITDLGVNLWLSDLEDLSYDMDDVLDEFATKLCNGRMRLKMDEMNEITTRLQDLFDRRKGLGLENINATGSGKAPQRRPTSALIIEPCLYGRDNDKKAILELLLSDQFGSNKVGVVPIVGMGGVGKTTLAQMIYNDEMVDEHFEMKAWYLARKTCFRLEDKLIRESEGDESISKARHSSYSRGHHDGVKKFEAFKKAKNLRTFLQCGLGYEYGSYLTSDVPLRLLPGLKRLRVLSLRRYRIGELSNSIGDLKHLRYLDFSCALILTLPESICTLYNLQTLILRDCENLKMLPTNTSDLISLRHLDITGANSLREMPPKIGKLMSLQTLPNFIVGNGNESTITELGNLIHLRGTLSISGLENVTDALDARRANLKDKQGLDVLLMKWSNVSDNARNGSVESKVLDMLEPHKKLKELSIYGYGGLKFPTWVGNSLFSNMVCLKFENCEKCTSLPPLGQLPSLAKLYIQGMKVVGNVGLEFYGLGHPNPFPALEILTFDDMPEWKEWTPFGVEEGAQAFARLTELSIESCPKLSHELPRNLPRLRNLDIKECPLLVVAWIPSPTELNEVRNTLHFDSLVSLHLKDVLIADSLGSSEVGDQVVLKNSSHSLLSSLTSLKVENIRGHKCLPSWVFQGLTGLQELSLRGFKELTTLWEDEARLQNCLPALRRLTIYDCPQLISLFAGGEEGDNLKSLQELSISHCPSLISFSVMPSTLKELRINYCYGLVSLPDLTLLNNLEKLDLFSCPSLTHLSSGSGLPPALKELRVIWCAELKSLIAEEGIKINCPSLESVEISECERLKTLPDVMQNNNGLKNLSRLWIDLCGNLESLPEGWFPTTNLREFHIYKCEKLKPLPNHAYNNNHLASVEDLELDGFLELTTGLLSHILDEGSSSYFTNLTELGIFRVDIGKLCGLHRLYSLRKLYLWDWDGVSFPEDEMLLFPSSLVVLWMGNFLNLEKLSFKDFEILVSLERLEIRNCPKLTSISELRLPASLSHLWISGCPNLASFPEQGLPPSLSNLWISDCPNLASFPEQGLPPSLSILSIFNCPNLASFPEQGLPPSLLNLEIDECPILKQRCEKGKGQYWRFITHIPQVTIDNKFVFDPTIEWPSSKSRHCTNMTAPECESLLFPLLSSAQYLSCMVLSLQNHLGSEKGCWEVANKASEIRCSYGFSSKSRHCTNMTAPECASPLFPLLSSAQYLSCLVLSLQWFPLDTYANSRTTLEARKGVGKAFIKGDLDPVQSWVSFLLQIDFWFCTLPSSSSICIVRGGGIHAKAEDVGADSVENVEWSITEMILKSKGMMQYCLGSVWTAR
ncbi:hypothetical protein RHGRI_000490 [Rhododendron griersonianum]|uniref:Disease resistance RPP13-like protein 1 n=1 Tax=Rhododendron griersonianum TaxID=479676 RepID=A0AAV6LH52_9ERIC|nr:hypothetical protein RHGRI_000490 [Rhododendron griersonianum]